MKSLEQEVNDKNYDQYKDENKPIYGSQFSSYDNDPNYPRGQSPWPVLIYDKKQQGIIKQLNTSWTSGDMKGPETKENHSNENTRRANWEQDKRWKK